MTIDQIKSSTNAAIRQKVLPNSITKNAVAEQLDNIADGLKERGVYILTGDYSSALYYIQGSDYRTAIGVGSVWIWQPSSIFPVGEYVQNVDGDYWIRVINFHRAYLSYVALLRVDGDGNLTPIVFENELGIQTGDYTHTGTGVYSINKIGAFPLGRTTIQLSGAPHIEEGVEVYATNYSANAITITSGVRIGDYSDIETGSFYNRTLEIRVYGSALE